ncbi:conserved hypothetical protein [Cohaesibacter sp. ES.047]|uniref:peptidoglycan editing factor PgeF n=1 Tax=Cohaesibacter sp. ES.047 TaxID=1798205 RepID=UPI000BB927D0|nr:peptidoglycan editing factor PgeF [Cohaesibacter sp. ES.047]SNY91499.1 conserved hypothetical protein [Cohaesibacter sp. ES.047]
MRIEHPALSELTGIQHGFFTRNGGTSSESYQSLNCGYGSDDDHEQVRKNRARVAEAMTVTEGNLVTAHQVHSPEALIIDAPFAGTTVPKVDALVTAKRGLAVAILTADCGPLLFADPNAGVVAAAHAGWRGAFDGVIESTLGRMEELGATKRDITAILGPTISRPNYEVDLGFKDRFTAREAAYERFFSDGKREGHVQFDLPAFILSKLQASGVGTAISLDRCTYALEDQFFSYRRSTHQREPDYGRQISAITVI